MAFNNETSKNGYRNTNSQYQQGNKQNNKRFDDNTRRNTRNNSGYGTYANNNKYPRDTRRQPKRENGKYEKDGYQRNKHYNNHTTQKYNLDKIQPEETLEDIQNDIAKLEKEIRLEIGSIKTIRFF